MSTEGQAQFGRYRVLGRLATGGMAEVLLGRLSGPSGFERPVVIKRILPQHAAHSQFRNMFLDEARLAAGIQHPNVVQHFELGEHDDELYLVMEYLSGEPLSSIRRRAHARGVTLSPEVAAHIVSEACAGLHAAHELVDGDGVAQEIVHRDVSPQNLFVTYDGVVKIIDFGIAKAANRITETEAGTIKGKFDYMSPEQARAEPLDRRSDIFALGIVLHELLTGRRLFKRRTSAGSLRAILQGEIPTPSSLEPGCPADVEAVCMKALALSREDRFSTAMDMRRALVLATPSPAPRVLPEEALRDLMQTLFPDRIRKKHELLVRVRDDLDLGSIPEAEVDTEVELPGIPIPTVRAKRVPPLHQRRRGLVMAAVATVSLLGIAAGWSLRGGALGAGDDGDTTDIAPARDPAQEARVASLAEPAGQVEIVVESDPPARLVLAGEDRGVTPLTLVLPRSSEPVSATLSAQGYAPETFQLVTESDQRLRMALSRSESSASPTDLGRDRRRRRRRSRPRPTEEEVEPGWENARF